MIRLIQITDSHLGSKPGTPLLSMDTDESLMDVLHLINRQQPEIDVLLATGDITSDGSLAACQRFHDTVRRHIAAPMAWLPGNHDDDRVMAAVIPESRHQLIFRDNWLIILLDSHVPGEVHGHFSAAELDYLTDALAAHQDRHILLCFHHQPVPTGSRWLDRYIIQNAQTFWERIRPFPTIRGILWGHIHQEFDQWRGTIRLLATPSTCAQFAPQQHDFLLDHSMPGYRWLQLLPNGDIRTGVNRVPEKDYGTDFDPGGHY